MPTLAGFDHFVLTVADIAKSIAFYSDVLGMQPQRFPVGDGWRHALAFGPHKINLHEAGSEFLPHATHPQPGSGDFCLTTDTPLEDWLGHLSRHGIAVEEGPVPRTGARGPITSLYLRDPDSNLVEIARYD